MFDSPVLEVALGLILAFLLLNLVSSMVVQYLKEASCTRGRMLRERVVKLLGELAALVFHFDLQVFALALYNPPATCKPKRATWLAGKVASALQMLTLAAGASTCAAAVNAEQAGRLGRDLTPLGGEKAGNAAGTIPAWEGGITRPPPNYRRNAQHLDPFANDRPLFSITPANYKSYGDKLSEGQKAMFAKYSTFRMDIYPTRRTASFPERIYQFTKRNASTAMLAADGDGIRNAAEGIPFPIPRTGAEAIWNHKLKFNGVSVQRWMNQAAPTASGQFNLVRIREELLSPYHTPGNALADTNNVLRYAFRVVASPARFAGQVLLVHESLNGIETPQQAWVYNPEQRRVRRAPNVAYDNPGTASEGLRTNDMTEMFSGELSRFNWELKGKREMYVPYNSYKVHASSVYPSDILKPGHVNPALLRYELHRMWVVEARLKPGNRHINSRRTFFLDEDSWQILLTDHYDGQGHLWRHSEAPSINYYEVPVFWSTMENHHDLKSGRYIAIGLDNQESPYDFSFRASAESFSPQAIRSTRLGSGNSVQTLPPEPPETPEVPAWPPDHPVENTTDTGTVGYTYVWNSWFFRKGSGRRSPAIRLLPESNYSVALDLAAYVYKQDGVDAREVRRSFRRVLQEAIDEGELKLMLQVLVLTDHRLSLAGSRVHELEIDLRRIRNYWRTHSAQASREVTLDALRADPDPDWRFANVTFDISTGATTGWASLGLSLWHEGRPLDEIIVRRCITHNDAECSDADTNAGADIGGSDLLDIAQDRSARRPAAALLFVALAPDSVVGVFSQGSMSEPGTGPHVWNLASDSLEFLRNLASSQEQFFNATEARHRIGEAITKQLFPPLGDGNEEARAAFNALNEFVGRTRQNEKFAEDRPQLFVRMLRSSNEQVPMYPVSLMNFDGTDEEFLGYWVEIVSPLRHQRYGTTPCPVEWQMLIPWDQKDADLVEASKELDALIEDSFIPTLRVGSRLIRPFIDIGSFSDFIGPPIASATSTQVHPRTFLATVSHHGMNSLQFTSGSPVSAANFSRPFGQDSIAVLAGCSTGNPGPGSIVDQLNQANFNSIVVTNTGVSGSLAGAMVRSMVDQLETAPSEGVAISELLRRSQRSLLPRFKEEVLNFIVVGNPDALVCHPKENKL